MFLKTTKILFIFTIYIIVAFIKNIFPITQADEPIPLIKQSVHLVGLKGLKNVGIVAPGIFRGAQPKKDGYETLKKMGIKVVLNLRTTRDEKVLVEGMGMKYIEKPINIFKNINAQQIQEIIKLITDPDNQPIYIHCKHGADRTGLIIAIYRIEVERWSIEEAEEEMESFGFHSIWFHLKDFLRNYYKKNNL